MHCLMCSCDNGSLQQLRIDVAYDLFQQISFVLPALEIPDTKEGIYGCSTCLKQVETFYKIKQMCLKNIGRLNLNRDILKGTSEEKCNELKITLDYKEILLKPKLDIEFIKIETNYEDLLLPESEVQFTGKDSNSTSIEEALKNQCRNRPIGFKCSVCPNAYNCNCDLERHIFNHTEEIPKCPTCQKAFSDPRHLKAHKISHLDSKSISTDEKSNETPTIKERPFKCTFCQKAYFSQWSLEKHIRSHSGEKPYQCQTCQKIFSDSTSLNAHKLIHLDSERPYACNICHKAFIFKSNFLRHSQSRCKLRLYQCSDCSTSFRLALLRKIRTRTEEKPFYQCHICPYKSQDVSSIKRHISTHSGKKPFTCHFCKKLFI